MREIIILLPILGECLFRTIPKALPWADLFWPSRPCLPQPSTLPSLLLPFLGECWLRTVPLPSLFLYGGKELWSFLQSPTLYKQESPKLLISLELNNSTFVSSCRVYFSKEARSCGVFYQPHTLYKQVSPKLLISLELNNSQRLTLTESARKLFTAQITPAAATATTATWQLGHAMKKSKLLFIALHSFFVTLAPM